MDGDERTGGLLITLSERKRTQKGVSGPVDDAPWVIRSRRSLRGSLEGVDTGRESVDQAFAR